MNNSNRRRILIVGAQCDGNEVGESWCGYQWINRISKECDVTLLTLCFPGRNPPSVQLTNVKKVVEWKSFPNFSRWPRLNSSIKPWYPSFYIQARRWMKRALEAGEQFDLLHHLTPMAMRYPTPCAGLGVPYVVGPVAGGLPTPEAFACELDTEPLFKQLRNFDQFRLRYGPLMRRTYKEAEIVLCSGSYARDAISHLNPKRVELETEVGIDDLAPSSRRDIGERGRLKMLYVGRIVRTKGLRDAIRALSRMPELPNVTLDVAGAGEDLEACKSEAKTLGVANRVRFLGRQSRTEIENLYSQADLFLFPSFREPTGIVLFEAMRHGLPIITTNIGGPGHIVNESCGIRVTVTDPPQFSADLAEAILSLSNDPARLASLGIGARQRVTEIGLWDPKIKRMLARYNLLITKSHCD